METMAGEVKLRCPDEMNKQMGDRYRLHLDTSTLIEHAAARTAAVRA